MPGAAHHQEAGRKKEAKREEDELVTEPVTKRKITTRAKQKMNKE